MSDDGEKTFEPTPSRIAKAKREGNVVRAQEFGANLSFIVGAGATAGVVPRLGACAQAALVHAARGQAVVADVIAVVAWSLAPMLAASVGATAASLVQSGGLHAVAVGPKIERLAPFPGLKRMVSGEAVAHGARALLGVAIAAGAILPTMRDLFAAAVRGASLNTVAAVTWSGTIHILAAIAALGTIFALVEFALARRTWLKKLRMSLDEYKREMKEHDGDPLARARRRSLHRSLVRGAINRVKDASFVVVNPTHVAVALDYRPPVVPVPTVLVRAIDEMALRVRELANEYNIPVVENVPLARALYAQTEVGAPIPFDHYVAVAEIVCALVRSGALA